MVRNSQLGLAVLFVNWSFPKFTIIILVSCRCLIWAVRCDAAHCRVSCSSRYGPPCNKLACSNYISTYVWNCGLTATDWVSQTSHDTWPLGVWNSWSLGTGARFDERLGGSVIMGVAEPYVPSMIWSYGQMRLTWWSQKLHLRITSVLKRSAT